MNNYNDNSNDRQRKQCRLVDRPIIMCASRGIQHSICGIPYGGSHENISRVTTCAVSIVSI